MSLRILILGANGFIGSNLIERILATRDWNVCGVDIATHRLGGMRDHPRLEFHEADVLLEHETVDRLIGEADVVLPLVAIATPINYIREPLRTFEVTFESNLRVIHRCSALDKRIIFPSTSEVYGMSDELPFDEETSKLVLGPIGKHRWIYSCSKQLLDRVIHAHGHDRGLRYTIFRPFNWIGPRLDDVMDPREGSSRVVTQFIGHILRGEELQLVDGGKQRRCFLYIDDALDALFRILENRDGCADRRIFNLGNPDNDMSIAELAELLIRLVSSYEGYEDAPNWIVRREVPAASYYGEGFQDAPFRSPAIHAALQHLGWRPRTDLVTALRKTLDYYVTAMRAQAVPVPRSAEMLRSGDRRHRARGMRGQPSPSA